MRISTKLFFIAASVAGLMGCGGGSDTPAVVAAPASIPASAPVIVSPPVYLVTDATCASVFPAGVTPIVGKIDDIATYFGNFDVTLSLTGATTTFSIQSPGTATINGVTRNITSVCSVIAYGANWRRISFANTDSLNIDMTTAVGAKPCANGANFSIDPPTVRGTFSGCKP
jgi:hypothetical protein